MTIEELVDELNIHADMFPRMIHLYQFIAENPDEARTHEGLITLIQTAFWAGVEASHDRNFTTEVTKLYLRS